MRDIYNYSRRLERAKQRVAELRNSGLSLRFLDHLEALGLSVSRVAKYVSHLCTLLKAIDFDPTSASKKDVEKVVAWINSQQYKASTKRDLKLILRKLIQYAKLGSCDRRTSLPRAKEVKSIVLKCSAVSSRIIAFKRKPRFQILDQSSLRAFQDFRNSFW